MSALRSITLGFAAALCAASAYLLYPAPAGSASARFAAATAEDGGFDLIPPAVEDLHISARAQNGQGNALLAVKYAAGQALPASLPLQVGDTQATLVRDGKDPQLYTATIAFDFDAFVAEQARRQHQAPGQQERAEHGVRRGRLTGLPAWQAPARRRNRPSAVR